MNSNLKALSKTKINEFAKRLHQAHLDKKEVIKLTDEIEFSEQDAYLIQNQLVALREQKIVGMKMGLTSKAKMVQMNVDSPIYGYLTSDMLLQTGESLSFKKCIHPKVEPEIAFVLKQDIKGKVTMSELKETIGAVVPALEIIDSRYLDFKFTLNDVIADNASSTFFVIGESDFSANNSDISNLGMVLEKNGEVIETGSSAAILDNPLRSLLSLVHIMAEQNKGLEKGQIILAGAATKAIFVEPGDQITLRIDQMEPLRLSVGE